MASGISDLSHRRWLTGMFARNPMLRAKKGGQAPYGTRLPSYRCFLPDLAGFTGISMHRTQPQQKVDQEVAAIK